MPRIYRHILLLSLLLLSTFKVGAQIAMPDVVCVGQTKHYNVDPNPIPGSTYTWWIDGVVQSGITTNGFDYTWNTPGTYLLAVQELAANGCLGQVRSGQVTVNPLPAVPTATVTTQPTCAIATGTITVTAPANGTGITYTVTGTNPVTAAVTNATGLFSGLTPGVYNVTTSNSSCVSPAISLIVNSIPGAPTISGNLSVCAGSTTQLTGSGTPAATNPWTSASPAVATVSSTGLVTGVAAGASIITYTDNNNCPTSVTVTVNSPPAISVQPSPQTNCYGNQVEFSVTITGTIGTVTYQWQEKPPSGSFSDITGANSSSLTINNIGMNGQNVDGTEYQVIITDDCGSVTSAPALLSINTITDITPDNTNTTVCSGGSIIYSVTTQGTVVSYQWLKQNGTNWDPISDGINYSGTTTSQLSISNATPAQSGSYRVSVTFSTLNQPPGFSTCVETSSTMERDLTVQEPLSPPDMPANQQICYNAIPTELIATSASGGSGPYTYQWQNSPDGSVWTNIPGATDLTYSPPALTSTTYYRIVVIDGGTPWCGTVNSAAVLITVSPVPATPTASNNGPLCAGAALNLTTPAVTGATYAWSGPNGFTSALQNPTIAAVTLADAGTYSVTVTLSGCTSASGSIDLVVNNAPTLTAAGINPATCGADGSIDFTFTNVPNGSYTITYATGNFTNVNVSGGAATVTAPAGAYNNLEISVGTCTSSAGVNVAINAPSAPTLSATGNNPASCGADGSIDFTFTNVPNGSYTITYASGSFTNVNVSGGAATVTASAGAYNNLEISVGTCTSSAGVNVAINAPSAPTLSATGNNPASCGADGSIDFTFTNVPNGSYTITYASGSFTNVNVSGGAATVTASAGAYNNLEISVGTCTSATGVNVAINAPSAPTLSATGNNPASCGADGSIDFTFTNVPNGSYTITYATGSFTNVNVSGGAATVTAPAGAYNNLEISVGTCTSAAGVNVNINAPSAPTLSATGNNPASCGADGSIDFTFTNVPNGSYSITYASGSFTNVNVSGGAATVTASAGAYNNLEISVGTCTSASGVNVNINAPSAPTLAAIGNNPASCGADGSIDFTFTNVPNGSYTITYATGSFTNVNVSGGAATVTAPAGTYNNLEISVGTCTSVSGVNVAISAPSAPVLAATGNNPASCGADGSINFTFTNVPDGSYTITYASGSFTNVNVSGGAATVTAPAGAYNNLEISVGTCSSSAGVNVAINAPSAPTLSATGNNPASCGADGSIDFTFTNVPNGSYSITYASGSFTNVNVSGGAATVTASAGAYNNLEISVGTCTSSSGVNVNINAPSAPTLAAIGNNPASCGADGSIDFTFTNVPNGSYTITYASGSFTNVNVSGGAATVTASAGAYNNLEISVGTCTSVSGVNVAITAPSAPVLAATGNNPASCGADGSIDFTFTNVPNGSYTITYATGSFTNVNVSGGAATVTASAGAYNNLEISVGTCTSAAGVNVNINAPSAPVLAATGNNPASCGADGSIDFTFTNVPNGSYSITYASGSFTNVNVSGGAATVTAPAGAYNNLEISVGTCTSASGVNVAITAPDAPASPAQTTDCSLGSGNATVTVTSPTGAGLEYSLDGGAYQSNLTFTGVPDGNHNITVRNTSGCTTTGNVFSISCGCTNAPVLSLNSISGSTCGTNPVTVTGNTFSNANNVTITSSGAGSVTPASATSSPFSFTYTPAAGDEGHPVTITLTTDNPLGSPCSPAIETYTLTVNTTPSAPVPGTITQPTCTVPTGSVVLNNLPSGNWTINPGSIAGTETNTTITSLNPGNYNFTVTDANGCTSTASTDIVIDEVPGAPASPAQTTDCSLGSGNATVTVINPTGTGLEYSLDGGTYQTAPGFSGVADGSHTITVRNASGCTTAGNPFTVSCGCAAAPALNLGTSAGSTCGANPVNVTGNTFSNATTVTITSSGAGSVTPASATSSPFSFSYTPAAGDEGHTVTITLTTDNPLGAPCSAAIETYTLTVNATPAAPTAGTITQPTCTVPTGSVILNNLPLGSWTINPGSIPGSGTTAIISLLAPDTYNYTVTDAAGCTSLPSADIHINSAPSGPDAPTVRSIVQPTCDLATGSVILTGLPSGNWIINPGSVSGSTSGITIAGLTTGTHNFTVTDASGCTSAQSADIVINVQPQLPSAPSVNTTQPSCGSTGGTIVVTAPLGPYEYSIDGGTYQTSVTFDGVASGGHSITARRSTDNTCVSPATSVTIDPQPTVPAAPIPGTITQPTCTVPTGSVILNNLPAGNWTINPGSINGSGSTWTVSGLSSGSYNFTVTNSDGCMSLPSGNVVINAQPVTPSDPNLNVTQPGCTTPVGTITVTVQNAGETYSFDNGTTFESGNSKTGLAPGIYYIIIKSPDGCNSGSSSATINAQPPSPVSPTQTTDCAGGAGNATVTVTTPTGTGLEYSLDGGTYQAGTTFNTVTNGSHTITVMNSSGCTTTGTSFTVSCGCTNGPEMNLSGINGSTCGTTAITVNGNTFTNATTVAITSNGAGIVNPAAATTSPFAFTYTPAAADAGNIATITFTTDNPQGGSCAAATAIYSLTVNNIPGAPTIGTITQPTCNVPTGSIQLNGLPSTGTWTINPGAITGTGTTTTITLLSPGPYNFTVTNSAGCTSAVSADITINGVPGAPAAPTIGTITQPTCILTTGSVVLNNLPAGNWTINPGSISSSGTSTTISGLSTGSYSFSVTDASGCVSPNSADVVINLQPTNPPAPTVALTQPTCSTATGIITVTAPTGAGMSYSINGSDYSNTTGIFGSLASGIYSVTARNADGCISSAINVTINAQPLTPTAPILILTQPTCSIPTGTITVTVQNAGDTYSFDNGAAFQSGNSRSGLAPGTYNVIIQSQGGCNSTATQADISTTPGSPASPTQSTDCSLGSGNARVTVITPTGTGLNIVSTEIPIRHL